MTNPSVNPLFLPRPKTPILFPGTPPATGTGTLIIHLEDYNDNAPYVVPSVAQVCEDAHDMNVAIVGGRDKDLPPNAAPFKIELGKQPGLDKTWKVSRLNCEYFLFNWDSVVNQMKLFIHNCAALVQCHSEFYRTNRSFKHAHVQIPVCFPTITITVQTSIELLFLHRVVMLFFFSPRALKPFAQSRPERPKGTQK